MKKLLSLLGAIAILSVLVTACSSETGISDKDAETAESSIKAAINLTEAEGLKSVMVYRGQDNIHVSVSLQAPFDYKNFYTFAAPCYDASVDALTSLGKVMGSFSYSYSYGSESDDSIKWFSDGGTDGVYSDKRSDHITSMTLEEFVNRPNEYDVSDLSPITEQNLDEYIEVIKSDTQEEYSYTFEGKTFSGTQSDIYVRAKKVLFNSDVVRIAQLLRGDNIEVSVRFFTTFDPNASFMDQLSTQKFRLFAREDLLGESVIIESGDTVSMFPRQYVRAKDKEGNIAVRMD